MCASKLDESITQEAEAGQWIGIGRRLLSSKYQIEFQDCFPYNVLTFKHFFLAIVGGQSATAPLLPSN